MKKVMIIGSGPAGISAALYIMRGGNTEVTVISNGAGALSKAEKIENYYGFAEPITGAELEANGIKGAERLGVRFVQEQVVSLSADEKLKPVVITDKGEYHADALLIATGAARKTPRIQNIVDLEGKGVSYCAICDAFFYRGKDVCVIGSGEYAVHEAQILTQTSKSVTVLTNGEALTADVPDNIQVNTQKIVSVDGTDRVEGVTFEDGSQLAVSGVFVAVGVAGSSDLARKVGIAVDGNKIKVDENMQTSIPGFFSAGDCTGGLLQVAKAVYDGATAGLSIIKYLKTV